MDLIKPWPEQLGRGDAGVWECSGDDIWAMLCASRDGDLARVRELIAHNPRLAVVEYWYTPPIHFAVREGHLDIVKLLLEHGANPSHVRDRGDALTTMAHDRGHEAVAVLLEEELRKRKVAETSHPIHDAASAGNMEELHALLQSDSELVKRRDSQGRTPLHCAAVSGQLDAVMDLVEAGADVDAVQTGGSLDRRLRPAELALWHCRGEARDGIVQFLIDAGADYNIILAASRGDEARVREILRGHPGAVQATLKNGRGALCTAAQFNHLDIVRLLLIEYGVDPTWSDGRDATKGGALWYAAHNDNYEMAKVLLEHGADPNATMESAGSAVSAAKDPKMRALMLTHGGRIDPVTLVYEDNVEALILLAERDREALVNSGCGTIYTHIISEKKHHIFNMLLSNHIGMPRSVTGCRSYLWKDLGMIWELLDHGMNADLPDWQHVTPLHNLSSHDPIHHKRAEPQPPVMDVLRLMQTFLDYGANINAIDEEYRSTPLGWAARCGQLDVAKWLIEHGADVNLAGAEWATPVAWARRRGHGEVVELLVQSGAAEL